MGAENLPPPPPEFDPRTVQPVVSTSSILSFSLSFFFYIRSSCSVLCRHPRLPVTQILPSIHKRNLSNNVWGRGGQNRPWVIETLRSSEVREGEDWFEPVVNIPTPLFYTLIPVFLFAPLQLNRQKKLWGWGAFAHPNSPMPLSFLL